MSYLYPAAEYLKPWRLVTLALGMAFLIAGALWSGLPDWDIPVSFLMALPAYLTAAPSLRVVLEHRWALLPTAAFWTWFTVDGTYIIYWGFHDPEALDALRSANFAASMALYIACGLVWYHRGTPTFRALPQQIHKR